MPSETVSLYKSNENVSQKKILETLNSEILNLKEQAKTIELIPEKNSSRLFPVDIFPKPIQDIIHLAKEYYLYHSDYSSASILYTVSVIIGNKIKVISKERHISPNVFIAIVGEPGSNKTAPLNFFLKPIIDKQKELYKGYLTEKENYKNEQRENPDTEKNEPILKQYLLQDFTTETVSDVLLNNPTGIGVYSNELSTWLNSFEKYKNNSDIDFWLNAFDQTPIYRNRKTSDPKQIADPYISVGGTIQPVVLKGYIKNKKFIETGLLDRMLIFWPENVKAEYWKDMKTSSEVLDTWKGIVDGMFSIDFSNEIPFTQEAEKIFIDWFNKIQEKINNTDDEVLKQIYPKLQLYLPRIVLLLEVLHFYTWEFTEGNQQGINAITAKTVKGAIKALEYFEYTAIKTRNFVLNFDPMANLTEKHRIVYEALPEKFQTKEGVEIANKYSMSKRTFKRFIQNTLLFKNSEHGVYEKIEL